LFPLPKASIKASPSDWRVYEQLELDFTGAGEHAYFYVEKTSQNTADVARALALASGVAPQHVGFCGRKDKHAITRQWFSVPTPSDHWQLDMPGVRCLSTARHTRKLRLGQHTGNRFRIRLSELHDDAYPALGALASPYPNYFGPQRVSAANVAQALAWLARPRARAKRSPRKGWHLSVLRSMLFNAVLDVRVAQNSFARVLDGDVLEQDAPTGPLWGRGRSAASGAAAQLERQALAPHAETCTGLEFAGVVQGRRRLGVTPADFSIDQTCAQGCEISFVLPAGAFATAMLSHKLDVVDRSKRYA